MFAWIMLAIAMVFPTIHLLFFGDRSAARVGRVYLSYLLPLSVGLGGLFAFAGHTLRADRVAQSIGWPAGNPFQFEVAAANLAFGVLGLLSLRFRDGFWTATVLGYGIFLEGAACVHLREIVAAGNWSVNNAGPILIADVLFPLFLVALLALARCGQKGIELDMAAGKGTPS